LLFIIFIFYDSLFLFFLTTNYHRSATRYNAAAVCGAIAHTRCLLPANQHGCSAFDNTVRRTGTGTHSAHNGCGLPANKNGRRARR
jgi:hypothetical protein